MLAKLRSLGDLLSNVVCITSQVRSITIWVRMLAYNLVG
jgi:hypothetical protein